MEIKPGIDDAVYRMPPATLARWAPKPSGARLMLRIDLGQQDVEVVAPDGHIYDIVIDPSGAPALVRVDREQE